MMGFEEEFNAELKIIGMSMEDEEILTGIVEKYMIERKKVEDAINNSNFCSNWWKWKMLKELGLNK